MWLLIISLSVTIISGTTVIILERKRKINTISNATKYYFYLKEESKRVHNKAEVK